MCAALNKFYSNDPSIYEIGVDEAGRGPMFGRVYSAAVILPKDDSFDHSKMKDSKKFHSHKKLLEAAKYIEENALAWAVTYEDEKVIDDINILQATQQSMHKSIISCMGKSNMTLNGSNVFILVDGNYFNQISWYDKTTNKLVFGKYTCIEGGDNKYTAIAAASILAKAYRDNYIQELCEEYPQLDSLYSIGSNKGYGAKKHLDGIAEHGITQWHRKSFGICKTAKENPL